MNDIILGDNLAVLREMEGGTVDLCYIDPPFFTQRDHARFDDRWEGLDGYLAFMEPRVREIHRVLDPAGSFYLHCDHHADGYLRVLCDGIFGRDNFRNRVTWRRNNGNNNATRKFGCLTDTILFYTASDGYTFNVQHVMDGKFRERYNKVGRDGRRYSTGSLIVSGKATEKILSFGDMVYVVPDGMRCKWTQATINERLEGDPGLIYWTRNGVPRYKIYLDASSGRPVQDFWDDVTYITATSNESLGYPTQKPEALLERIIKASSDPGDVVLDAFAGSGTTCAVAKRLGRRYIGIDSNPDAVEMARRRLHAPGPW